MKRFSTQLFLNFVVVPLSILLFVAELRMVDLLGFMVTQSVTAGILLVVLCVYSWLRLKETDERESLLGLQADSISLATVVLGLLFCALFYPDSHAGTLLWIVLGLALLGKIVAALISKLRENA
jgi:hypothetical protein